MEIILLLPSMSSFYPPADALRWFIIFTIRRKGSSRAQKLLDLLGEMEVAISLLRHKRDLEVVCFISLYGTVVLRETLLPSLAV